MEQIYLYSVLITKKPTMTNRAQEIALDKLLVSRFKSGDETVFEDMVSRYWDRIYNRVHQMLKNPQDAEEVTQDAFVRAHRGLENFRGDASFSTWLYQIATNLAHNKYWYWFRRKRAESISMDQSISEDGTMTIEDVIPDRSEDPAQNTVTNELANRVTECLPALSEKQREILTLRIVQNLTYEEISQKLSISLGTVKSRIARARENLREKIGSDFA